MNHLTCYSCREDGRPYTYPEWDRIYWCPVHDGYWAAFEGDGRPVDAIGVTLYSLKRATVTASTRSGPTGPTGPAGR